MMTSILFTGRKVPAPDFTTASLLAYRQHSSGLKASWLFVEAPWAWVDLLACAPWDNRNQRKVVKARNGTGRWRCPDILFLSYFVPRSLPFERPRVSRTAFRFPERATLPLAKIESCPVGECTYVYYVCWRTVGLEVGGWRSKSVELPSPTSDLVHGYEDLTGFSFSFLLLLLPPLRSSWFFLSFFLREAFLVVFLFLFPLFFLPHSAGLKPETLKTLPDTLWLRGHHTLRT